MNIQCMMMSHNLNLVEQLVQKTQSIENKGRIGESSNLIEKIRMLEIRVLRKVMIAQG